MPQTALISVSDKQGIIPFAEELTKKYGFQIIRVEKHTRILSNDRETTEGVFLSK